MNGNPSNARTGLDDVAGPENGVTSGVGSNVGPLPPELPPLAPPTPGPPPFGPAPPGPPVGPCTGGGGGQGQVVHGTVGGGLFGYIGTAPKTIRGSRRSISLRAVNRFSARRQGGAALRAAISTAVAKRAHCPSRYPHGSSCTQALEVDYNI